MRQILAILAVLVGVLSCTPRPGADVAEKEGCPPIYPDYADITIPPNIAPLNFLVRGDAVKAVECVATCGEQELRVNASGNKVCFGQKKWRKLLEAARGKTVEVSLSVLGGEPAAWERWHFSIHVAEEEIDAYLTYRLIEPNYEVWNRIQIMQRCVENFDVKALADHNLQENRCMNCHTFGNQDASLSMMYVRGAGGGAILNRNGELRKLDINARNETDSMVSGSVYFGFSPSGRYITFSSNVIIPAFHAQPSRRMEVFDTRSDVYVADLQKNVIYRSPLLADPDQLETFPTFSPDGRHIYYCTAPASGLRSENLEGLQYRLVRIAFDEHTGRIGNRVDTIVSTPSVCHPKISPDGRRLLYTVASYGTFPIWHTEADLRMLDLETGETDSLPLVNSPKSDTYHSWSSNSRWFVFASKRDDGLYGKPYFCYVSPDGNAHKPFVLPQRDPEYYDNTLKSFNVPELGRGDVPFDAVLLQRAMAKEAEPFSLVNQ